MREQDRPPVETPADDPAGDDTAPAIETEAPPLVAAYRHDVHKLRGRSHAAAADTVAGVRVNEAVPLGADRDAARLSRPEGEPTQTVPAHAAPSRVSLLTGATVRTTPGDRDGAGVVDDDVVSGDVVDDDVVSGDVVDSDVVDSVDDGSAAGNGADDAATNGGLPAAARPLVVPTDPARLHAAWLTSRVAAAYNESLYYPYTSLKYHTLVVAALLAAYREGHDFADLFLAATPGMADTDTAGDATGEAGWTASSSPSPSPDARERRVEAALAADVVVAHETVLWTPALALHVTPAPGDRPAVRLGTHPQRAFGRVWARLPAHPLPVDAERRWRLLDAQLRRVRAFSTALQYVEEFVAGRGAAPGAGGAQP